MPYYQNSGGVLYQVPQGLPGAIYIDRYLPDGTSAAVLNQTPVAYNHTGELPINPLAPPSSNQSGSSSINPSSSEYVPVSGQLPSDATGIGFNNGLVTAQHGGLVVPLNPGVMAPAPGSAPGNGLVDGALPGEQGGSLWDLFNDQTLNSTVRGALFGGVGAAARGQPIGQGILAGAVGGGAGSIAGQYANDLFGEDFIGNVAAGAAGGAVGGGASTAVLGGNQQQILDSARTGAAVGGTGSILGQGTTAVTGNARAGRAVGSLAAPLVLGGNSMDYALSLSRGASTPGGRPPSAGTPMPNTYDENGTPNYTAQDGTVYQDYDVGGGDSNFDYGQLLIAGLNAGLTIYAAQQQADAAMNAAGIQVAASERASALQQAQYNQTRADNAPYREAGYQALGNLQDLTQPGGEYSKNFTMQDMFNDPGYDFRMQQGTKALERGAASKNSVFSGGQAKALTQYGQDYASGEYGKAFDRFYAERDNRYNKLASIAGIGQVAQGRTDQAGQNLSVSIGDNILGAGNAQAAGVVGAANARTAGIYSIGNQINDYYQDGRR